MRPTLDSLETQHAACTDAVRKAKLRQAARELARELGIDAPSWAVVRREDMAMHAGREPRPVQAVTPRHSTPARIEIPDFAKRWIAAAPGSGACAHANPEGLRLSYWSERSGERMIAFIAWDRFKSENAAAYALAQGAIRFTPMRRGLPRGTFKPRSDRNAKAPSPHEEPGAFDSDDAAE